MACLLSQNTKRISLLVILFFSVTFIFPQAFAATLVFNDQDPGPIEINFRDILVTDGIEPSINIPDLFPFESGTLTVTDHNANVDLTKKEIITVQINGVDVVLEETNVNTGIFTYTVNAGDAVSYDPGTLGLARATINFDFDTDPENGLALVEFVPLEKYIDFDSNGGYNVPEVIYKDADDSGDVSNGDTRLAFAAAIFGVPDGSVVDDTVFADDIGFPLVPFASIEKHEDSGTPDFDVGETIYYDADTNGAVSIGDTRIANAQSQGFDDGSVVAADAIDGKGDIIIQDVILNQNDIDNGVCGIKAVTHPFNISFEHGGMVTAGTNIGVTMSYADYVPNDASLLQMYYQPPGFGCSLITLSGAFDPASHHDDLKTVDSNPTFDNGGAPLYALPTIQGNYILGFDVGSPGSGTGGISKGGLIVNALGFVKTLGHGTSGLGSSSFGKSSFTIISGGEQGFGGILENSANTFDQTKIFKVGEKAELRFDFTEGGGIGKIEHIGLFANIRDGQKKYDSDTFIIYNPLKSLKPTIHDPNGLFSEATFELLQKDTTNFVLKYDLTFAKPMQKSDLILESWNTQKQLSTNKIPNAIEVVSSGIVQEQSQPEKTTFEEDVTNDQVIPVWVKTNAKWWADGTIDNDNFISGIEYLVNEGIIKVSLPEGSDNTSISEMQPWIKNTAGWWADDMISEDEFLTAIEWLISNNIIQVAA